MNEQGNLLLAIVLSLLILLGFNIFFEAPKMKKEAETKKQIEQTDNLIKNNADSSENNITGYLELNDALSKDKRIKIDSPRLQGSINLKGLKIDDLTFKNYKKTLDKDSELVILFKPTTTEGGYFSNFGWIKTSKDDDFDLPDEETIWKANSKKISDKNSAIFSWKNNQGIEFEQEISIDEDFMFTIKQKVLNNTDKKIRIKPTAKIRRTDTPKTQGFFILHEGPIGIIDDVLEEIDYKDLKKKKEIKYDSKGGWFGITDKYWLATLIPDQNFNVTSRYNFYTINNKEKYQVDYTGGIIEIPSNESIAIENLLYAGAKEVELLDKYEKQYSIPRLDFAIDFGWYYFLTKPFLYLLIFFKNITGNFGISIILLTLLIKLVFFPLANKSYVAMQKMKDLQPQLLRIKEMHKNDKVKLNQEMMALYKREKVNPAAGCLPILIQIPVFFALYKILFVSLEMRQAPFYFWINDLSVADPTSILNLFGLLPYDPNFLPKIINIGIWPLIMGGTMYLQQKLNPQPTDPMQAKIFMYLPIFFTFILAPFPSGLVIYWTANNVLSMGQQILIKKKMEKQKK
ncbi:MAG: Membrane protein insertase YidC [Alphaproteobacteria bacterium MarineAlpha6_Bin4]|nr:MAG: Membrane protein insertase YidC [Alphaproteobacteria bacterium MarineAlpha6_Bin3]PPR37346.1 MAG: Membrane protein insertase YidC [Alphaproteobacteria bacterium MarineAlpha6_Bin4]|tara:strand:- start:136 stop:1851 length:1716 start_codon:yes stop_codon:yes gene_type:complete